MVTYLCLWFAVEVVGQPRIWQVPAETIAAVSRLLQPGNDETAQVGFNNIFHCFTIWIESLFWF